MFISLLFSITLASELCICLDNVQDSSSLCRVFLSGKQSPDHEMQQKLFSANINNETHSHSTELSFDKDKDDTRQVSIIRREVCQPQHSGLVFCLLEWISCLNFVWFSLIFNNFLILTHYLSFFLLMLAPNHHF